MMEIPSVIPIVFVLTTIITFLLFWKSADYSRIVFLFIMAWLVIQGVLGYSGFYQNTTTIPPRIFLTFGPTILLFVFLFVSKSGKKWMAKLDLKSLTILHVIRIPVELVLYGLFLEKAIPELMTFSGRNFDILAGITAPIIYYFAFIKKVLSKQFVLIWNLVCLVLLLNIVINATLSAPLPFQQFAFDQPNRAILYFPFIWLPAVVVPIVMLSHFIAIKRLNEKTLRL